MFLGRCKSVVKEEKMPKNIYFLVFIENFDEEYSNEENSAEKKSSYQSYENVILSHENVILYS